MLTEQVGLYHIINKIGHGGFAEVFKASHSITGDVVAVKRISKTRKQEHNIKREIEGCSRVNGHKNVAQFVEYFEDEANHYLVYEFIEGTDLFTHLEKRKFSPLLEKDARKVFQQLLNTVLFAHSKQVVHLDIKLDNVMIDNNGRITLIDFGLCDFITEENGGEFNRRVGSEEYCPAEMLEYPDEAFYGTKVDVWCLGVVLYALLSANFPFDPKKRKMEIRNGGPHPSLKFHFPISECAKDLLRQMLCTCPERRISLEQIMKHPWVTLA